MVYEKYWFFTTLSWKVPDLKKDDDRKTNNFKDVLRREKNKYNLKNLVLKVVKIN